jgi:translation initiation factor 4A
MLSRGFKDQLDDIMDMMSTNVQLGFFTATMTQGVMEFSDKYLRNPLKLTLSNTPELALASVQQFYINTQSEECKLAALLQEEKLSGWQGN